MSDMAERTLIQKQSQQPGEVPLFNCPQPMGEGEEGERSREKERERERERVRAWQIKSMPKSFKGSLELATEKMGF